MAQNRGPASPSEQASAAVRTCVGCRNRARAADLLRVVIDGGVPVFDRRRRLPGRGAWLHPDPGCLRTAAKRRALPRALRVSGPLELGGLAAGLDAGSGAQRSGSMSATAGEVPPAGENQESRSTRHESAVKLKP